MVAKVLDHVVSLKLAVNQNVKANLFLLFDPFGDFVLVEFDVLLFCDGALSKVGAVLSHFLCLREASDCRRGEEGKLEFFMLNLFALGKVGLSDKVLGLKRLYGGLDFFVGLHALFLEKLVVILSSGNLGDFADFLLGERKVLEHVGAQLCLVGRRVGNVQERAGSSRVNSILVNGAFKVLEQGLDL